MTRAFPTACCLSILTILATPPSLAQVYGPDLDLTASGWEELTGWFGNVVPLLNDENGNLYFDFPVDNPRCKSHCDTINYLYTRRVPADITGGTLVVTLKVEALAGSPAFQHTGWKDPCPTPPTVRPFFWSNNNSMLDGNRWWADQVSAGLQAALTQGELTLSVPIDPANFRGVNGQMANQDSQTLATWAAAIANVSSIGVTFGGGCSYGHGVYVQEGTGTARFTLSNYDASPPCPAVSPCFSPSCVRSTELGATSTGLDQCLATDGGFLNCDGGQTVNVVSTACGMSSCCFTFPACFCPTPCASGEYLECRPSM